MTDSMPDNSIAPTVSVIVPLWNVQPFLPSAVESVFGQTFRGWELVLVDDGSTDGSAELARAYAARAPERVRYLQHPGGGHRGVAASRNLGVRNARGRYLAFLDAEDVWFPAKLERQLTILEAEPRAAMIDSPAQVWHSWSEKPEDRERDYVVNPFSDPGLVAPPALLLSRLANATDLPTLSTVLIRREALDRVGGFDESFPAAVQKWEDAAFLSKVHLRESVFVMTECSSRIRRHQHSPRAIMSRTGHMREGQLSYLGWLERHLKQYSVDAADIWQAHRRAVWPLRHPVLAAARKGLGAVSAANARRLVVSAARRTIAESTRGRLKQAWKRRRLDPPLGTVDFGDLRRVSPVARKLGRDRGLPIDRHYIERFLAARAERIAGHVLEIGDDRYTRKFGGTQVTRSDVLHVSPDNPRATIVADLTSAAHVSSDEFDCIILTQTLPFIYDLSAVVATLHRVLKPGGVVLATMGGVTQTSRTPTDQWDYYWGFSTGSARALFEEQFPAPGVFVESFGNVLAATAFLHGLASEEMQPEELDYRDPDYQFLIAVTAVKPHGGGQV
jgi:glycosyltransferase involved in cell wall biosynthesis/SAM-dependent methyltransferase